MMRMGLRSFAGRFTPVTALPEVAFSTPADATTIPINADQVITGTCSADADTVQLFKVHPTKPIGFATLTSGTWTFTWRPDLLDHGNYTITAVVSRGASTAQATRTINVTAVPLPGTWSANGGSWYDYRLISESPGAAAPTIAPLEGSGGNLVPSGSPVVAIGAGYRKAIETVTASSQYAAASSSIVAGTRPAFSIVLRVLGSVGSARLCGFGNSGNGTTDYVELLLNSGKVVQAQGRAPSGGATVGPVSFATDLDVPSLTTRTIIATFSGTECRLYYDGVADANNPLAFDPGAFNFTANRFVIAARAVSSLAGYLTGQFQCVGIRQGVISATDALAIHNAIVASNQAAPTGTPFMFLGHSLIDGGSSGGWRKPVVDYWAANSQAISSVGPYTGGAFSNNAHNGQGGNNMATMISQQITPYIGSGKAYQPRACAIMCWANDVDEAGVSTSTLQTRYTNFLDTLWTAGVSGNANFRIIASNTCEPYDPAQSASAAARISDLNAGLIATIHDNFDAAHPSNTIIRWNAYNAIGGWSSACYGTDRVHPLPGASGYYKFANDATYGMIQACASLFAAIG